MAETDFDIWDQLIIQDLGTSAQVCATCQIDMKIGNDILYCPSCQQEVSFDLGTALQPVANRSVVLTTGGVLCSFGKAVYNKRDILIEQYNRILAPASSYFVFPPPVIERAVDILQVVQEASTTNRGRHLSELMAGALFAATCESRLPITETAMAKLFKTRSGLSRGKNAVLTMLVKMAVLTGCVPREYLRKDPKRLASEFIKERMNRVGIWTGDKLLYTFIKCLVKIEDLYMYIDTQVMNAKIAGSLAYYAEHCVPIAGSTQLTMKDITSAVSISAETVTKYYDKLRRAAAIIEQIAKIINVPMRPAAAPAGLIGRRKK